jgi:hypothetical protein
VRATVEFEPDTARAIEELRRDQGIGVSEAVNELIRRGLLLRQSVAPFVPRTRPMGLALDVSGVAEALETLEGPDVR